MTKTPIKKLRSKRLRTDDSPEKAGGTRPSSQQIVTMRSVGSPDPLLLVRFIAGYMAAIEGCKRTTARLSSNLNLNKSRQTVGRF